MTSVITHYEIRDSKTGKIVGTAKTRAAANRRVDKLDNAYGGYRYHAHAIWSDADDNLTFIPGVSY